MEDYEDEDMDEGAATARATPNDRRMDRLEASVQQLLDLQRAQVNTASAVLNPHQRQEVVGNRRDSAYQISSDEDTDADSDLDMNADSDLDMDADSDLDMRVRSQRPRNA